MTTTFKYIKALAPVNLLNGALWLEEEDISKIPESVFNLPEVQQAIADDELVEVDPDDLPQDVVSPTLKLRGEWDPSNSQLPSFRRIGDTYLISASGEVNGLQLSPGMRVLFTTLNTFEIVGSGATATIDDWVLISEPTVLPANGHYYWDLTTNYDITLPATANVGDFVEVYHILGDVTNYLPKPRILRNGLKIQGLEEDLEWNLNLYRVTFTYVSAETGWIIYSAYLQVGNNEPALPPRSGSVWLRGVQKGDGEPSNTIILTKTPGIRSDILELAGNVALVRLTISVIPGAVSGNPVVYAYSVPGAFSPTPDVPFPVNLTPKVTATLLGVQSNLEGELDHLSYQADVEVIFSGNAAQIVLELSSGGYAVIPYFLEAIPYLINCDITSPYAVNRTGFSAGSVVTLSFTSTEPFTEIAVWPHDGSVPLPEPLLPTHYTFAQTDSGTVSITISAINLISSNNAAGKLYVSAVKYGQYTKVIQTTTAKVFDERFPQHAGAISLVDPPGVQTSIKGTQDAVITVQSMSFADYLTPLFPDDRLQASPSNPPVPYTVTAGSCTFSVRLGASPVNGVVQVPVVITSAASGKSVTVPGTNTFVSTEDAIFPNPVIEVNNGQPVVAIPIVGKVVTVEISSVVSLKTPQDNVTIPGVSTGAWSSPDNGHTWIATGTVYDTNPFRGELTATADSLETGANTLVGGISGTYILSGFEKRAVTATIPFSPNVALGSLVVDGPLTVLDLALQPTTFTYNDLTNTIVLTDPAIYESNAAGTMPIYVSQDPVV